MKTIAISYDKIFVATLVSLPILALGTSIAQAKTVKMCKSSVVGVGYSTSKSLARSNAVQAWSRTAKKRYGRTYRLSKAKIISDIRCQYVGEDSYTQRSQRKRRFNIPGEVGNPDSNWSCTVNAKPCLMKTVYEPIRPVRPYFDDAVYDAPFWKRKICKHLSRKAVRQQRRNRRLGCEFTGRIWHANSKRHFKKCLSKPMGRSFRQNRKRKRMLRRCS